MDGGLDGKGVMWTENLGKGALEGWSRACVKDSGCNHSIFNQAAIRPWPFGLPVTKPFPFPLSCKTRRGGFHLFKPHPSLPFSLKPTASWLSSLLRLLSMGSDPLSEWTCQHLQHLTSFSFPVSLLLFFFCFCFCSFLMRNFKHTKVRKMIA